MSESLLGYLLSTAALLLFTTAILATKLASSRLSLGLGFLVATATNVGFAALALVVQFALRTGGWGWNTQAFWLFAAAGAFATYLGRWFFYESVVRFGPAKASIFQVSSPLFTALMAWLFLDERLTPWVAGGMALTVAGLMLVSCKPGFFSRRPTRTAQAIVPAVSLHQRLLQSVLLLGTGSSLAYAIGNVLRGSAVRLWNEPILGAWLGALSGLALHLAFSSGKRELIARLQEANRSGLWLYGLIGIATISAQMCTIGAMRYLPLSVVTLVTLCTPLLVFPLSYWLFKQREEITPMLLVGGTLTLLGIFIIVLR